MASNGVSEREGLSQDSSALLWLSTLPNGVTFCNPGQLGLGRIYSQTQTPDDGMEKVPRNDRDRGGPVMFIVAVPSQSLALLKKVLEDARGEQPLCRQSQFFHRRADSQAHGKRSPIQ